MVRGQDDGNACRCITRSNKKKEKKKKKSERPARLTVKIVDYFEKYCRRYDRPLEIFFFFDFVLPAVRIYTFRMRTPAPPICL